VVSFLARRISFQRMARSLDGMTTPAILLRRCPEPHLVTERRPIRMASMAERHADRLFLPCRRMVTHTLIAKDPFSNNAADLTAPLMLILVSLDNDSLVRAMCRLYLAFLSTCTTATLRGRKPVRRETIYRFVQTTTALAHLVTICTSIPAVLVEPCHSSQRSLFTRDKTLLAHRALPSFESTLPDPTRAQDRQLSAAVP
jgi:hypothetical protein